MLKEGETCGFSFPQIPSASPMARRTSAGADIAAFPKNKKNGKYAALFISP